MHLTKKISLTILAIFSLVLLSSCKTADTLSASIYAEVEEVNDARLALDLGVWEQGVFTSYEGETSFVPGEIVSIETAQGEKVEYSYLEQGDILEISFQTNVKTSESAVSIKILQEQQEQA